MMIKTEDGLVYHDDRYFYCSDFAFMVDGINYEKDENNGRCYRLEESDCLRADCDGKLVKRRIAATVYNQNLQKLKSMMAEQYSNHVDIEKLVEEEKQNDESNTGESENQVAEETEISAKSVFKNENILKRKFFYTQYAQVRDYVARKIHKIELLIHITEVTFKRIIRKKKKCFMRLFTLCYNSVAKHPP